MFSYIHKPQVYYLWNKRLSSVVNLFRYTPDIHSYLAIVFKIVYYKYVSYNMPNLDPGRKYNLQKTNQKLAL